MNKVQSNKLSTKSAGRLSSSLFSSKPHPFRPTFDEIEALEVFEEKRLYKEFKDKDNLKYVE